MNWMKAFFQKIKADRRKCTQKFSKNNYYIVFAELQAYSQGKMVEIDTYEGFMKRDCKLILLIVDSYYTTIYCKDKDKLEPLYKKYKIADLKMLNVLSRKAIQKQSYLFGRHTENLDNLKASDS
ncbi:DUF2691 family protein [Niallia nealsonii]|uniref:DUF2691 family protein n=1 Tax=Niallia nealsonii TaxID=115979 RepID=UPI001F1C06AD|nr:DUF2691 family protein [Niallia nealsonii]